MNEHDSENIAGMLESMGYVLADDPFKAEVVVLNTCSVREHADVCRSNHVFKMR